ncbi:amylovoran biosynthesis protein [Serratia phage vB_SmaS-Totoro]|nr:amylovoran biosynthesis protein [Serratia phage vB_SmaS-Totoro]
MEVMDGSGNKVTRMTAKGVTMILPVSTIADLRKRAPYYTGEIVNVKSYDKTQSTGGGSFIARQGNVVDDGGHLITSSTDWYWERVTKEVNLFDYGIKVSSRESGKEVYYDVSDALQAAATRASNSGLPLVSSNTFSGDPGNDAYPRWATHIQMRINMSQFDPASDGTPNGVTIRNLYHNYFNSAM